MSSILHKFGHEFRSEFKVDVFQKLSLPAISEQVLWNLYDNTNFSKVFTFADKFGDVNEFIRSHILGGPSIGNSNI